MSVKDPSPHIAAGEERRAAGDLDGALDAFTQACAAAPSSAHAHNKLGTVYVDLGRWDDAFSEFSKAAQLDPRYAPAHSNLGNVYRERGRLDEAVACYSARSRWTRNTGSRTKTSGWCSSSRDGSATRSASSRRRRGCRCGRRHA